MPQSNVGFGIQDSVLEYSESNPTWLDTCASLAKAMIFRSHGKIQEIRQRSSRIHTSVDCLRVLPFITGQKRQGNRAVLVQND